MKTHTLKARGAYTWLTAALLTWTLASVGACSSDDDNPSPSTGGKAGAQGGAGGSQSGGAKSTGGATGDGGVPGDAGSGGIEGEGGNAVGGGTEAGGATGTGGGGPGEGGTGGAGAGGGGVEGGTGPENTCPATDLEFLNRPNSSQCSAFPNTKVRLPGLNADGSLPPLPGA